MTVRRIGGRVVSIAAIVLIVGIAAAAMGLAYLTNFLPLGTTPGAVSSSGTIALISFFVGLEDVNRCLAFLRGGSVSHCVIPSLHRR